MARATGKQFSVGMRRAVVFELDADGYPAATGTSAYQGFEVISPKAYTLTIPDVRKITHLGNDRVLALDFLPPTEAPSAELRTGADDNELNAFLTNVNTFAVGEADVMGYQTDQQGSEPDVAMMFTQQSLATAGKQRHYRFHIIPKSRAIPMPAGMDENAAEVRYAVAPNPSTTHIWGTALVTGTEGTGEAAFLNGMSKGRPNIVAFKGDGATLAFLFPTAKQAIATFADKVEVWVEGVLQTGSGGDYTATAAAVTFDVAPALNARIVVFYEY